MRATFRTAIETGIWPTPASLDHCITFSPAERSARRGVARGAEEPGLRSESPVPRRRRRHRGPTTLHRNHAETDCDLLHLQRRAVREAAFEAQLAGNCTPTAVCLYWILKLKARFLSGDYAEALASADKAKALLWASAIHVQRLDYFYYAALTVAALYERASADERQGWRELLTAHREQLWEWAENNPPTFADKHDTMRLYEQAIQSAREQLRQAKESPTNLLQGFTWPRVHDRRARPSGGCVVALRAGGARQGATTRPAPPMAARKRRRSHVGDDRHPSSSWMSGRWSRLRRRCPARSSSVSSSRRCYGSRSACRRRAWFAYPVREGRTGTVAEATAAAAMSIALRQTAVSPAELLNPCCVTSPDAESVILDDALAQSVLGR